MSAPQILELFAAHDRPGPGLRMELRMWRKRGRPFLLLPLQARAAAAALALYPAQTPRARTSRILLRWLVGIGVPLAGERVSFDISPDEPFLEFLSSLSGASVQKVPELGILAGNPASDGQRFLVLVFDAGHRPVAAVKVGMSERAKAFIEKEESFLRSISGKTGIPKVLAVFQSPRLRAFAMEFFSGDSPRPRHRGALPALLGSWIEADRQISLSETPDWLRLENAAAGDPFFSAIAGQLRARRVRCVLMHGDLAPWNIKVSLAGRWTVIDWERGERLGIPGWDWFHYVIQTGILVERRSNSRLIEGVEALLASAEFGSYAKQAGIVGCERELVLAYLLHAVHVIKPSGGLPQTKGLLQVLGSRWQPLGH
jgi:hypothetical protein